MPELDEKKSRHDGAHEAGHGADDLVSGSHEHGGKHGAAGSAAAHRIAHGGVKDLGHLAEPGGTLKGSKQNVTTGETLRFEADTNQIRGLGQITIDPPHGVALSEHLVKAMHKGQLGDVTTYQYNFAVGADVKPGTTFRVTAHGNYQVRDDPTWAFTFDIVVA
jgi:hypothetical protein